MFEDNSKTERERAFEVRERMRGFQKSASVRKCGLVPLSVVTGGHHPGKFVMCRNNYCQVCSRSNYFDHKTSLENAVVSWKERKYQVHFLTLRPRWRPGLDLRGSIKVANQAWNAGVTLFRHSLKKQGFSLEFVRFREETFSQATWSSHMHVLVATNAPSSVALPMLQRLISDWSTHCARGGLRGTSPSFQDLKVDVCVGEQLIRYLTKHSKTRRYEAVRAMMQSGQSISPLDLAVCIASGDFHLVKHWLYLMQAVHSLRLVTGVSRYKGKSYFSEKRNSELMIYQQSLTHISF